MDSINKYAIVLSPIATTDFYNIYNNLLYELKEPIVAKHFYTKIITKIYSLNYLPYRYPKIGNSNIRKLPIDKYVILYEVSQNTRSSLYITYLSR